jgi:hypothetical protein
MKPQQSSNTVFFTRNAPEKRVELGHGKHDEDALVFVKESSTPRSAGALAG